DLAQSDNSGPNELDIDPSHNGSYRGLQILIIFIEIIAFKAIRVIL
ncbi:29954_t:CDS:1, partial [Gigaspora margarita]